MIQIDSAKLAMELAEKLMKKSKVELDNLEKMLKEENNIVTIQEVNRAEEAYDTFDRLTQSVHECLGEQATVHNDQNVNHPDFYALIRYETEKASVNISVKDKSALERTFVFIRIQGEQNY